MTDRLPSPPATEGALILADALRFLHRNGRLIVLLGVAAALAALLLVAREGQTYRAAALLMVGGERPNADFLPPLLPADGYLRLLESRPVMSATLRRVTGSGGSAEAEGLAFDAELLTSRRGELGNSTLIELTAEAPTAAAAAEAANAWATVFLETEYRQVLQFAMQTALYGLDAESQKSRDKLERMQDRAAQLTTRLAETRATLKVRSRLSEREVLSGAAAAGAVLETEELNPLYSDLMTQLATAEAEIGALRAQVEEFAASRSSLAEELKKLETSLAAAAAQLPQAVVSLSLPGVVLPAYGSARLVSAAVEPLRPESARGVVRVFLAFLGGVLVGILAAAVREGIRTTAA